MALKQYYCMAGMWYAEQPGLRACSVLALLPKPAKGLGLEFLAAVQLVRWLAM